MRFPDPVRPATVPCARCHKRTRVDRLRVTPQSGTDLLDLLNGDHNGEPDDECDGWDR